MLSVASVDRLCRIYQLLSDPKTSPGDFVSSKILAQQLGMTETTVRKDISLIGGDGLTKRGYAKLDLKKQIGHKLGLDRKRTACIVGLGRLGTALLDYPKFSDDGFEIVAGFDSNINKVERLQTKIKLYSLQEAKHVITKNRIEIGILAVPAQGAQKVALQLVEAGIKGILNFSPVRIHVPPGVATENIDFTNSLRTLSVKMQTQLFAQRRQE